MLGFGFLHDSRLIPSQSTIMQGRGYWRFTLSFASLNSLLIVAARFSFVEIRWLFRLFGSVTSPVSGSTVTVCWTCRSNEAVRGVEVQRSGLEVAR